MHRLFTLGSFRGVLVAAVGFQCHIESINKGGFLPFAFPICGDLSSVIYLDRPRFIVNRGQCFMVQALAAVQNGNDLPGIEIYRFDSGVELVTPDIEEEVAANDNLPPWKR